MNSKDLIGKKVRGFKFEENDHIPYNPKMDKHIGEIGVITCTIYDGYRIDFNSDYFYYPGDQIEKHLVKELPKSFACTNTNQELWDKYIEWLNKEHNGGFAGHSKACPYYGISINGEVNNFTSKHCFDTILSIEEWDEIVNGTETKTEKTMKNYEITRQELKKIHDVACNSWKNTIEIYGIRNRFENTIEFTQTEVDEMFKAATPNQIPVLENIFGKQTAEIDLSTGKVDGKGLFNNSGDLTNALITVRTHGHYKNKAFILNNDFNWNIWGDDNGQLCLVPTRK